MYLKELFDKYADWTVLKYFLEHPDKRIHVQELSRTIEKSAPTVSSACKAFEQDGLLSVEKYGNVHIYALNKEHDHVPILTEVIKLL